MPLSAVIITKNEAHIIEKALQSLQGITNDIVIVDSGSTDGTQQIGKKFGATVMETTWNGYGANKNKGNVAAANDWILSLDADEAIDETLRLSLQQLDLANEKIVYEVKRKSFFCNKLIRYGEWAGDRTIRLFNRNHASWNDAAVHERLAFAADIKVVSLKGSLLHYTVNNVEEYLGKTMRYAKLSAEKYFAQGKKTNYFKIYLAPLFTFLQHYIFRLGFLDGREGFLIARTTARYTHLKYRYLKEMNDKANG